MDLPLCCLNLFLSFQRKVILPDTVPKKKTEIAKPSHVEAKPFPGCSLIMEAMSTKTLGLEFAVSEVQQPAKTPPSPPPPPPPHPIAPVSNWSR